MFDRAADHIHPAPDAALELQRRKVLTRRVKVGAYYSDGARLAEVVKVYELGHIILRDVSPQWDDNPYLGCSIDAFRREWWLVREGTSDAA